MLLNVDLLIKYVNTHLDVHSYLNLSFTFSSGVFA